VRGRYWSPDGDMLLVCGTLGVAVFDAAGVKMRVLSDDGGQVRSRGSAGICVASIHVLYAQTSIRNFMSLLFHEVP
jgi:hypothetical protein